MDKFKESLSKILKSMVPSKETRKDTVERFKSQFKTDPNTVILKKIALSVSRSNSLLQNINDIMEKQNEEKEKGFFGKLFDTMKNIGIALAALGGLGVAIAKLTGIPQLIGRTITAAFAKAGLSKLFSSRTTPNPNMTKPTTTAGAVRIVGPLPLPVKGLGMGGGGMDIDGDRKGGRKGGRLSRVGATQSIDKVLEKNTKNKALNKVTTKGPAGFDTKRLDADKIAKQAAKDAAKKKLIATTAAKTVSKKIPGGGAVAGTAFAADRARKGDYKGASMEFLSGLIGATGIGIPLALGIDAALLNNDLKKLEESELEQTVKTKEEVEQMRKENPNLLFDDKGDVIGESPDSPYMRELKHKREGTGGYFAGTHDADPASMANKRQNAENLKNAQLRNESSKAPQPSAPINVVNNTNNTANNSTQNIVNKTKPRDGENALEREVDRHASFGF